MQSHLINCIQPPIVTDPDCALLIWALCCHKGQEQQENQLFCFTLSTNSRADKVILADPLQQRIMMSVGMKRPRRKAVAEKAGVLHALPSLLYNMMMML